MVPYEYRPERYSDGLNVWGSLRRDELVGELKWGDTFFVVRKPTTMSKQETIVVETTHKANRGTHNIVLKSLKTVTCYYSIWQIIGATKEVAGYLMFPVTKEEVSKPRHVKEFTEVKEREWS